MHSKLLGPATVATFVAGLLFSSGAAAQSRPAPFLFPGMGASIGAEVRDPSPAEIAAAGLSQPGGAVVTQVDDGRPASKAGLGVGDMVIEFDGERVRSARHLIRLVGEATEGRSVKAVVATAKARRTLDITPVNGVSAMLNVPEVRRQAERGARDLAERFRYEAEAAGPFDGLFGDRRRLGVELMPLPDQLAAYFGVKAGVLVASVQADSAAARAGVKAGDVIITVNSTNVAGVDDVVREVRTSEPQLTLTVIRDKKELMLKAVLPEPEPRVRPRTRPV